MRADALKEKIEMHEDMKEVLMECNLELKDKGINKVQCIDGEIRMTNIRNRDKELSE